MRENTIKLVRARLLQLALLGAVAMSAPSALRAQAACAVDRDCRADQYCASATGTCSPRCDAAGLCVGPAVSTTHALASDGVRVCFAAPAADPTTGVSTVWSWDGSSARPRRLGSVEGLQSLLVADGFCYFAGNVLKRAALIGAFERLVHQGAAAPSRVWLGPEHVWWTIPVADGLEVWRSERGLFCGAPELFALAAADQSWEAASDTELFRRARAPRACDLIRAPLEDLANETATRMSYSWACTGELRTDDERIFFNQYSGSSYQLNRIDFADWSAQIDMGLASTDYGPVRYVLNGEWVYAARTENPQGNKYAATFFRKPKRLAAEREQLYQVPEGQPSTYITQFAVLGDTLVFVTKAGRLAATPIAPHPCSAELPCPRGAGQCSADLICEPRGR
jgi:hypothetical protein